MVGYPFNCSIKWKGAWCELINILELPGSLSGLVFAIITVMHVLCMSVEDGMFLKSAASAVAEARLLATYQYAFIDGPFMRPEGAMI